MFIVFVVIIVVFILLLLFMIVPIINIIIIHIISRAGLTWVPNWTSGRKRSMLSKTSPLPCQIRWKPSQRTVTIAASQQAVVLGYCSLPTCSSDSLIHSSSHSSLHCNTGYPLVHLFNTCLCLGLDIYSPARHD